MGISVVLQHENAAEIASVHDPTNTLHRLLPHPDDMSSRCLRHIDRYGDTVFNRLQMEDLLAELRLMAKRASWGSESKLVRQIIDLARKCKAEPHLYINFRGD